MERAGEWAKVGLIQFQLVRCRVVGHRGRFGVDVIIESPVSGVPAFIDFVMLADGVQVGPEDYPAIGQVLDSVTIDIMPNGELRLSSRASSVARAGERDSQAQGFDPA